MASRRQFDSLLTQLKSGILHPGILADWLQENDAGLDLWCLAYRDVPEPADEFQKRWAAWLREREPDRLALVGAVQTSPRRYQVHDYRWQLVRYAREDVQRYADLVVNDPALLRELIAASPTLVDLVTTEGNEGVVPRLPVDHPAVKAADEKALATVRRDRKRRVLALFPEVEYRIHFSLSHREMADWPHSSESRRVVQVTMDALGFRPDLPYESVNDHKHRCFRIRQTLRAPDLIPPDLSAFDPTSLTPVPEQPLFWGNRQPAPTTSPPLEVWRDE